MKIVILSLLLFGVFHYSEAFDPSKFLGKSSASKPVNPDEITSQDKANIENLIKMFSNLSIDQKMRLMEYRRAYQEALEELIIIFDKLPKEVKDALKYEKSTRESLSVKGQEELDKFIKGEGEAK